jgi:hypothetical protein
VTALLDRFDEDLRRLPRAWNRFWHTPRSAAPLAFVRIALGVLTVLWAVSLLPDARAFFGPDGVVPTVLEVRVRWGLLQWWRTDLAALVVVAALVPTGLLVALGLRTRAATVVSFVLLLSLSRRDPWVMNSGDALLRHATFFLALSPAGAALSLDRYLADRDRFWDIPEVSPWGLRLLQIQLSFVYLWSVFEKLRGEPWLRGTALGDAWRITDVARFGLPLPVYDSLLLTNLLTFATLVIELAIAVLIWNRRARLYVVLAGIGLHLGIEVTMAVGFFSAVAVSLYLAFVPADTAARWVDAARQRLGRPARGTPHPPGRAPGADPDHGPGEDPDRGPARPPVGADGHPVRPPERGARSPGADWGVHVRRPYGRGSGSERT